MIFGNGEIKKNEKVVNICILKFNLCRIRSVSISNEPEFYFLKVLMRILFENDLTKLNTIGLQKSTIVQLFLLFLCKTIMSFFKLRKNSY